MGVVFEVVVDSCFQTNMSTFSATRAKGLYPWVSLPSAKNVWSALANTRVASPQAQIVFLKQLEVFDM